MLVTNNYRGDSMLDGIGKYIEEKLSEAYRYVNDEISDDFFKFAVVYELHRIAEHLCDGECFKTANDEVPVKLDLPDDDDAFLF